MVQGVGFRPFLYRLAEEEHVAGAAWNTGCGVVANLEGGKKNIQRFLDRIARDAPPHAAIWSIEQKPTAPAGHRTFTIIQTAKYGVMRASLLPDIALCNDCQDDIMSPSNRRYRYPFTNCTNCGPRYSILTALPYDRENTTMSAFEMCAVCRDEYENPADRRFHAQPIACPDCGPVLTFNDRDGRPIARRDAALGETVKALRNGFVIAVKGLGGYQLICDAKNDEAIAELRRRKKRPRKPLAVMVSSLEDAQRECELSREEIALLDGFEKPIVLLQRRKSSALSNLLAPGNPNLGVMLPYTPLHYLLLQDFSGAIVATSGNLSSEPIAIDDSDAQRTLSGVADFFLTHNRPISRRVDDSVARITAERPLLLRRARGYAPAPIKIKESQPSLVALGGHLKNTIAKTVEGMIYISPHIGDLETVKARAAFEEAVADFTSLHDSPDARFATDEHEDYFSSQHAKRTGAKIIRVQHHQAHVYSVMAEHGIAPPALGVAWDGAGLGDDGTIWGGEFFDVTHNGTKRIAHFTPFPLPGGETAMHDPRRAAFGLAAAVENHTPLLAYEIVDALNIDEKRTALLTQIARRNVNAPLTSSVGRLFDAVSALLGLCTLNSFEGEAAMALEFEAGELQSPDGYRLTIIASNSGAPYQIDWTAMLAAILTDKSNGISSAVIAHKFHNALADAVVAVALHAQRQNVILSGGCFQNRLLLERAIKRLTQEGFTPIWPERLPPNDGGICLGQIYGAMLMKKPNRRNEGVG